MKTIENNVLTGERADEVIRLFAPTEEAIFIDDQGAWYAGGGYYRFWQRKDGIRAITHSRHRDRHAPQFLVRAWKADEPITNDHSFAAITEHAKSYRELVITRTLLKKIRYRDVGRDVYHGPHQHYESFFRGHDALRVTKSLFGDRYFFAKIWHPKITMWAAADQKDDTDESKKSRKDAELMVCMDFVASLERALASRLSIDPELRKKNPAHFHFGQGARIFARQKGKMLPGLEKMDAADGFRENVTGVFEMIVDSPLRHPARFAWRLVASVIEGRSLVTREETKKWPGCLNPKDELVRELSSASKYAYPLGGFMRPMKEDAFEHADCLNQPVFGEMSLFKRINRISSFEQDGLHGLSEAYLGPTIGSTIRFYWNKEISSNFLQNIGAVKIFRPDGSTITIFDNQTRVWISHEPERMFDSSNSVIPPALMKRLEGGGIVEIVQRPTGAKVRQLTFEEADRKFRGKFDSAFRSPHWAAPKPAPLAAAPQ